MRSVFALLVGIDTYPSPIPPLSGCVADLNRFRQQLEQHDQVDLHAQQLTNEMATKCKIVNAFQRQLGQAKEGDTALFYFSGHGAQEAAGTVFHSAEANDKIQGLVCYDSFAKAEQNQYNFLSDKELRYLISQIGLSKAHIVLIFDCCHSGENTRSAETNIRKRQISYQRNLSTPFPARPYTDFIFADQIPASRFQEEPISTVLPEAPHVQLAACLPSQSAYEVDGAGLFTTQLVRLLQESNNFIDYQTLKSKLPHYIPAKFSQTPLIYTPFGNVLHDLFLGFPNVQPPSAHAQVFRVDNKWYMDMGLMHGLSPNHKQLKVTDRENSKTWTAKVLKVEDNRTLLELAPEIEDHGQLTVAFDALPVPPAAIWIKDYADNQVLVQKLETVLWKENSIFAQAEAEEKADFIVHFGQEKIKITFAQNQQYYLVPLLNIADQVEQNILFFLSHMAHWLRVKNFNNQIPSRIPADGLEFKLHTINRWDVEESHILRKQEIPLKFEEEQGNYFKKLKLSITNKLPFKVHVSLLYLNMNFAVEPRVLQPEVMELEPGKTVYAFDGSPFKLKLEEEVPAFKLDYCYFYFKLIASTNAFRVDTFKQDALPKPTQSNTRVVGRKKPNTLSKSTWRSDLFIFQFENPIQP